MLPRNSMCASTSFSSCKCFVVPCVCVCSENLTVVSFDFICSFMFLTVCYFLFVSLLSFASLFIHYPYPLAPYLPALNYPCDALSLCRSDISFLLFFFFFSPPPSFHSLLFAFVLFVKCLLFSPSDDFFCYCFLPLFHFPCPSLSPSSAFKPPHLMPRASVWL